MVRAHWDGSFVSCVMINSSEGNGPIWSVKSARQDLMAENCHGSLALLEIQFIYSLIYSFTLTDGKQARRPLKILIWTITGGSLIRSNNYPHIDTYSSYDSVTFATVGKETGSHLQPDLSDADRLHPWVQRQRYSQGVCFCTLITWSISSSVVDI